MTKSDITDTQLALNDLYDVSDGNNTADQILVQDANGAWSNVTLTEKVQDIAGGMFTSSNTETGVTVTYNDSTNDIDVVLDDSDFALTGKVTGTATQTAKGNVSIATSVNLALSDLPSIALNDLSNVSVSSPGEGQVLGYNSGSWVPINQSTTTDSTTEGVNKYFTDDRVNDVIVAGNGLTKSYVDNPDSGDDTALDGRTTLTVATSNGVKLDGNDVELDYSVITDSDLSSGLPSGTGKAIGHLFFLI